MALVAATTPPATMTLLLTLLILLAAACYSSAFRPTAFQPPSLSTTFAHRRGVMLPTPRERFGTVSAAAEDSAAEGGGGEDAVAEEEKEAEEEAKEEEDDGESEEVKAIKAEIAELERTLNSKRLEAGRLEEEADDLSEGGYLRKCAEMDNVRKRRDAAFANDKFVARALVIQKFLPVYDGLNELVDVRYATNDFAKQYAALRGDFRSKFNQLEVEEYGGDGDVGKKVNSLRFATVGEEFSDDVPKGAVIEVVSSGMEVKGNVIRLAECVVSRGSEAEFKKAEEAKAKAEAEAAAAAAAAAEAAAADEEEAAAESEEGGKDE